MTDTKYPIILSFDVGVIHLSYCLLTQTEYVQLDGSIIINWCILDWNNIDLTNRSEQKCICGAKANLTNTVNNEIKYYCKTHGKKIDTRIKEFNECFSLYNKNICEFNKLSPVCNYIINNKSTICDKKISFINNELYYCSTHAKQIYKTLQRSSDLKPFKLKNSSTMNFDDVKFKLIMELENRKNLLSADYVVIENQPSLKNPRMKSIASTIYDYYLIRGIIDKDITKSNITQVKFMSPSNKLKIADEGDIKQLIKAKKTDDTKAYKLTKSLGIKYCLDLIQHLTIWIKHFNSHKKKDDLADSFLQGAYFYSNNINTPKVIKKVDSNKIILKTSEIDLTNSINSLDNKISLVACKVKKVTKVDKVDKVTKVDKVDKVDKVTKVDKVDKVNKVDKVDKVDKVNKVDKVDKVDKIKKNKKQIIEIDV
jgi:hypothetical protein